MTAIFRIILQTTKVWMIVRLARLLKQSSPSFTFLEGQDMNGQTLTTRLAIDKS